ncbi:MAG: TetR/AcrR family transcriptional regulator [Myxococcales bacterium]|jgi:AcrR family transcriptional regulator|nr:TetR/AcrR family transcriptional regulator [Myxococcales bacterium]
MTTDERRAQLVALGLQHFAGRAYEDVSIDEIAEAAGISKGLLYHYFPTKRDFYVAAITEAAGELLARATPDPSLPPLDRATRGIDSYLAYVEEHAPAYVALMSGGGQDPAVHAVIEGTRAAFLERLLGGVDAARVEGQRGQRGESAARAPSPLEHPVFRVAMRGFIGFAESASLEWLRSRRAMPREVIRDLLLRTFLAILQDFVPHPP